jgi:hypothetical protein
VKGQRSADDAARVLQAHLDADLVEHGASVEWVEHLCGLVEAA